MPGDAAEGESLSRLSGGEGKHQHVHRANISLSRLSCGEGSHRLPPQPQRSLSRLSGGEGAACAALANADSLSRLSGGEDPSPPNISGILSLSRLSGGEDHALYSSATIHSLSRLERQPTCPLPTTMMAGFGRCDEIAYSLISSLMLSLTTLSAWLSLDVDARASTSADCLLAAARRR